jgi:radical SAM enzyme (TIGR01210 family)
MKSDNKISDVIKKRTQEAHKTYSFNNDHNPRLLADYWFQNPQEGLTLFAVFYTQACRWAQCLGCNLPSKMSEHHISYQNIIKQIDLMFHFILSAEQKKALKKIIISNNGSILDEQTFSTTALIYFIAQMNIHCPTISVLSMETRPEYVDINELEVLSRAIKEGSTATALELAVGFEAFDDTIRNDYYKKGLDLKVFEKMAHMMSKYHFKLKVYFMLKPVPGISEEEAIQDVAAGINYLDKIAQEYTLDINMHLNPTYAAYGTPLETAFKKGDYKPPTLESVRKTVLQAQGKRISIFVGLSDEGLATPGGSFIRKGDEKLIKKINQFNISQNYSLLR